MKLQENLKAFVDGETKGREYAAIRKSLEEHPEMQQEVDDLNRLSASIRAYMTQPQPVGLEATLEALEKSPAKTKPVSLLSYQLRWVGGFAAAIVLVGVVTAVFFPVYGQAKASAKRTDAIHADKIRAAGGVMAGEDRSVTNSRAPAPLADSDGAPSSPIQQSGVVGRATRGFASKDQTLDDESLGGQVNNPGQKSTAKGLAIEHGNTRNGAIIKGNAGGSAEDQPQAATGVAQPAHAKSPANRSLVQKTAALSVKVKDVGESQQTVEGIAVSLGGYVQQSSRSESEGQKGEANLTVRVPVQMYDSAIKRIRGLGDVLSDSSSGNDVTADVVDMDARMKVLKAEESDYMLLLGRARSMAAIIEIKDKLTEIREEIESIDGQRKSTKDLATYSTINVQLTQKGEVEKPKVEEDKGWLDNTWTTAVDGLGSAGRLVAQLFIFVLVWSPLWIPVALLSAWLYRRNKW